MNAIAIETSKSSTPSLQAFAIMLRTHLASQLLNHAIKYVKQDVIHASFLITAIFVLHNFLIDENDDTPIDAESEVVDDANLNEKNDDENDDNKHENMSTRDILLRHIY